MKKENYYKKNQYCKKHKQKFMDHVKSCPVCLGEKMKTIPARKKNI